MDRYLIVGLGNPGKDYEKTRHNIGFRCVDALAAAHGLKFDGKKGKAVLAEGTIADKKVLIAKPQTYMNLSGESVRLLVDFYKIPLANVMVIMDDMDVPLGTLRIRVKGSAGGQNGMKNIINHLGTDEISRLRFGIGRPPGRMAPAAYVLQDFDKQDAILLAETMDRVMKALDTWLREGITAMMNRYNGTAEEIARNTNTTQKPSPSIPHGEGRDQSSPLRPEGEGSGVEGHASEPQAKPESA